MKITGYRVENYTMQMDRPIADANYPAGEDLMPASLLWIETDEGIAGIAPGGGDIERFFHLLEGEDPREVVGVADADDGDAVLQRLGDAERHGLLAQRLAKTNFTV